MLFMADNCAECLLYLQKLTYAHFFSMGVSIMIPVTVEESIIEALRTGYVRISNVLTIS